MGDWVSSTNSLDAVEKRMNSVPSGNQSAILQSPCPSPDRYPDRAKPITSLNSTSLLAALMEKQFAFWEVGTELLNIIGWYLEYPA
jgi:hypothetical protein